MVTSAEWRAQADRLRQRLEETTDPFIRELLHATMVMALQQSDRARLVSK